MKYAINREQQVDKIFQGYAVPGNDHPIPPSDPFYHSELPQRAYDPDKARWHLQQAGLDGLDIELSASDSAFPGAVDSATLMQEDARGSGLNLTVRREPDDGLQSLPDRGGFVRGLLHALGKAQSIPEPCEMGHYRRPVRAAGSRLEGAL